MYSDDDITSAVAAGVMTEEAASAFRAYIATLRNAAAVDEEHFRLVTGFNDIFVVIACVLLLLSVGWIGNEVAEWFGSVAVAAVAWGLAEFFVRKRRMALPAIILLLVFVGCVYSVGYSLTELPFSACALAAVAAGIHWRRFQVPITVAAGVAAFVGGIVTTLVTFFPVTREWMPTISFVSGMSIFFVAMRWDITDTKRQTRRSDVAFWLHLLAAPLLVHPVFVSLGMFDDGQISLVQTLIVISLYIAIALISLCVDRRALMVSALGYVLYAFSALLKQYGVISLSFAITAFIIGSALLLLSAFWHNSRAFVLELFPQDMRRRLPPCR